MADLPDLTQMTDLPDLTQMIDGGISHVKWSPHLGQAGHVLLTVSTV